MPSPTVDLFWFLVLMLPTEVQHCSLNDVQFDPVMCVISDTIWHADTDNQAVYSPTRMVSAGNDQRLQVWDCKGLLHEQEPNLVHTGQNIALNLKLGLFNIKS